MIKTYEKGSNPYFEYAMLKYSQVAVVERMKKDDVLEHINKLEFKKVSDVWQLIHTHLENVNVSLNVYHYSNYALPTTEKPTDKFDFICKNSKAIGAYQSGVLVNDFSYFVDSNTKAKQTANEFSQRKYEVLHKASAFTHIEKKAELASVEARKVFFEAFLTILHKLHNADFNTKLDEINAELAPHLFIPEPYIRLENRQKEVAVQTTIKRWQVGGDSYRTNIHYVDSQLLSGYTTINKTGYTTVSLFYHGLVAKTFYLNPQKDTLWYCTVTSNNCAIVDRLIDVPSTTNKTFNYMIEVEYQTEYGKDKLENEAPPAEPYKIKKLHGNWVTHCGVLLDTGGKSEDDILQMENPPCLPQEMGEKYDLSIAQIDSVISWIDAFNSFFNQNEATQLTDDLTFGNWYSDTKSLSPAYVSYEYTDFFKKIVLFEPLNTMLEKFKQSKTPQVVEILSTMPQTKYKGGDLIELSKQEMINERQRLESQNA